MWEQLPVDQKTQYKKLMSNFASLSEAFAQKQDDMGQIIIAPIVNSKFQETMFKTAFHATIEDIGNSSFDASIKTKNGEKFLVGIKSFGIDSGLQKIAQFKKDSQKRGWNTYITRIQNRGKSGQSEDDFQDYLQLAKEIAIIRNERIASSISQLRGFKYDSKAADIESVYHVLMPSSKIDVTKSDATPTISVGETTYSPIDIAQIEIVGPSSAKTLQNFVFTDGIHRYQYNSADSQLLMSFKGADGLGKNSDIVKEIWDIEYVLDAFEFFANLKTNSGTLDDEILESYSWFVSTERRSGFNGWFGAPKTDRATKGRQFLKIKEYLSTKEIEGLNSHFEDDVKKVLFDKWTTKQDKIKRENLRELVTEQSKNDELLFDMITTALYRSYKNPYEVYIPIPNAKKFNLAHPDFFGKNAGKLNSDEKTMAVDVNDRCFELMFLPSGDSMTMFIGQDTGKGIESNASMHDFGKWVLRNVFQLSDHELLTDEKLHELQINAMRFKKYKDGRPNSLEFIYIDTDEKHELPDDLWT